MKKEIEIIVVGSGGSGVTKAFEQAIRMENKAVVIVQDEQKPFEPEPFKLVEILRFDEPLIINTDKKWFEHYGKFKKNKFGRKK